MKSLFLHICLFSSVFCKAQFSPQAELPGSSAIHKDSALFIAWADSVQINRGQEDICANSLNYATYGFSMDALGKADGQVVSLGDSGIATYYFSYPIINQPGPDFAIFENGFANPLDSSMAYLELAFVEVSSDGIHYVRFPASSNTNTQTQIAGAGTYMDASLLHNLAGKYKLNFGVPFDLLDVAFSSSVQINNIHYIRIVDVIGSIDHACSSQDNNGQMINDPYPTPFSSGGFDLDALGVIHADLPSTINMQNARNFHVFPNPCQDVVYVQADYEALVAPKLFDMVGRELPIYFETQQHLYKLDLKHLEAGSYILQFGQTKKLILKQ